MVYFHGLAAVMGLDLLITEVSRSHSVGFLRTSDRLLTKISTWKHNTHKRQTFMQRRYSDPQSQQASGRAPTP